jgi:hypothetical protein
MVAPSRADIGLCDGRIMASAIPRGVCVCAALRVVAKVGLKASAMAVPLAVAVAVVALAMKTI